MKVTTLKPRTEAVEADDGRAFVLRTPSEDDYCAWEDAKISQVEWRDADDGKSAKVYRHLNLYKATRALLVGRCLFEQNGDGPRADPVGEEFVRKTFSPAAVTAMYEWLTEAGFFNVRASGDGEAKGELKN